MRVRSGVGLSVCVETKKNKQSDETDTQTERGGQDKNKRTQRKHNKWN